MHKNIDRIINIPRYGWIYLKKQIQILHGELTKHGAAQLIKQIPSKNNTFCDLKVVSGLLLITLQI